MAENIRFYPKTYQMSDELKAFFTEITNNEKLQEQLYNTEKLSDVADIANGLGFNVTGAEVLQAQAGRVLAILDEQSDDVERLTAGIKPKTGVQWGRGGGGFLDSAGYWLRALSSENTLTKVEEEINKLLANSEQDKDLERKLLDAKTFNDLAELFQEYGFKVSATDLLSHQAQKVLALSEEQAGKVADN